MPSEASGRDGVIIRRRRTRLSAAKRVAFPGTSLQTESGFVLETEDNRAIEEEG